MPSIFKKLLKLLASNIFFLLIFFILPSTIQAATYYVATGGNDSNPGTVANPWRTIQKAADTLVAGDTVYIRRGTYREIIIAQRSGSAGSYITYTAYPGDKGYVIIDGTGISGSPALSYDRGLFTIYSKHHLIISDLTFQNVNLNVTSDQKLHGIFLHSNGYQTDNLETYEIHIIGNTINNVYNNNDTSGGYIPYPGGIWLESPLATSAYPSNPRKIHDIFIKNNTTNNTYSSGIGIWRGYNIIVDGNEVINAVNRGRQECITVSATELFEVKNNIVRDRPRPNPDGGGEGIVLKGGVKNGKVFKNHVYNLDGEVNIYLGSQANNIEIYQNKVSGGGGITLASEVVGSTLNDIKIYNNLVYNNSSTGIWVASYQANQFRNNISIFNNTVYGNSTGSWGAGMYVNTDKITNLIIRNNIFAFNTGAQFKVTANALATGQITATNNLIYGANSCLDCISGNSPVLSDPLFADRQNYNFHLTSNSPAIDAGSSQGAPSADYDDNPRQINAIDIGAFEYGSANLTPPPGSSPTPPGGQLPTPTPVRGTYNFPLAQLFDFSPRLSDLESVFENVVRGILGFTLIILFIMIIIGGYKYLTSGGDPKSLESAKATLTYAIAGIILLATAYLILVLLETFTGAPVTEFRIGG
ncbi:hypothetical protein A2892_00785 [Candidatus Woesebacteria bacterium RIFCSPLOWO2_01_FULL_39_10b]|uniref:Uncharacterized protein n=1 Tax=Candidatus Woesebacteria bacterium RIFCSPLOWO2_01_FULL_39_10b TaxID=1802517 RepID=A0A1F8B920_9BACT|nr:MAG: hypothetical protein A2892_00785 [Candidatus Woesebacteria bacterium RIFCSPLOWO2_01_FULL_39_10b]